MTFSQLKLDIKLELMEFVLRELKLNPFVRQKLYKSGVPQGSVLGPIFARAVVFE